MQKDPTRTSQLELRHVHLRIHLSALMSLLPYEATLRRSPLVRASGIMSTSGSHKGQPPSSTLCLLAQPSCHRQSLVLMARPALTRLPADPSASISNPCPHLAPLPRSAQLADKTRRCPAALQLRPLSRLPRSGLPNASSMSARAAPEAIAADIVTDSTSCAKFRSSSATMSRLSTFL